MCVCEEIIKNKSRPVQIFFSSDSIFKIRNRKVERKVISFLLMEKSFPNGNQSILHYAYFALFK